MNSRVYIPTYMQIAEEIKNHILKGEYSRGENLPPEVEMAKEFSVTRTTLRSALSILEKEGMIARKRRSGTVILANKPASGGMNLNIGLALEKNDTIESVFDLFAGPATELTHAIADLMGRGQNIALRYADAEALKLKSGAAMMPLDGFIVPAPARCVEFVKSLAENRIPHVGIESHIEFPMVNTVMSDDEAASYECVKDLYHLGHRKIVFAGGLLQAEEKNSGIRRRLKGFVRACNDFGIGMEDKWIMNLEPEETKVPEGYFERRFRDCLIRDKDRPTAVVCAIGLRYIDLMRTAEENGIKVPDDISAICVDVEVKEHLDAKSRQMLDFASGYNKPREKIGRLAAEKLFTWLMNPRYTPSCLKVPHDPIKGKTIRSLV